jgi:hypothetical protein
MDGY